MTLPEQGTSAADAYLCAAFRPPAKARSITRIVPHAQQEVVHHMLLLGVPWLRSSHRSWEQQGCRLAVNARCRHVPSQDKMVKLWRHIYA